MHGRWLRCSLSPPMPAKLRGRTSVTPPEMFRSRLEAVGSNPKASAEGKLFAEAILEIIERIDNATADREKLLRATKELTERIAKLERAGRGAKAL